LTLPPSLKKDFTIDPTVQTESSIVVIGANGSGKTRLGTWLEFNSEKKALVHRISAQKSLTMPKSVSPTSLHKAKVLLYYGHYDERQTEFSQFKLGQRWGRSPDTHLLNDFDKLLVYLYSDNYESLLKYSNLVKKSSERIEPPISLLDKLKDIWEFILPHRQLEIGSGAVNTVIPENTIKYNASLMSDGERVIFYLIGECLCAPTNGIIIIDEPEIHLHKSIQQKLWDKIEKERPDCLFVYLTHDFDFASSRINSTKICLESYNGKDFSWYIVPEINDIPEKILLEVVGCRKPVIFVEGEEGSLDTQIYRLIYENHIIRPLGSCSKVLSATKSFNEINDIHRVEAIGIVDRDYKNQQHVDSYSKNNVFCPNVAEVENLFLLEEVLIAVAEQYCVQNKEETISDIKSWVINEFVSFYNIFATESTAYEIDIKLGGFDGSAKSMSDLKKSYMDLINNLNIDSIFEERVAFAKNIVANKDYNQIIKSFNHKALVNQVGKFFDMKPTKYKQKVIDIILAGNKNIVTAIKKNLPVIKGY